LCLIFFFLTNEIYLGPRTDKIIRYKKLGNNFTINNTHVIMLMTRLTAIA